MGTKATHHIRGNALHPIKAPKLPAMPTIAAPDGTPSAENVPTPGQRT